MSLLMMKAFVKNTGSVHDVVHMFNFGKRFTLQHYPPNTKRFTTVEKSQVDILLGTGYLDSNDSYIYENEIVKSDGRNGVVKFKEGQFIVEFPDKKELLEMVYKRCAVIGNVFLNKELIPQKKINILQGASDVKKAVLPKV